MEPLRLLIASEHPEEVREMRYLLDGDGWTCLTPADAGIGEVTYQPFGGGYREMAARRARAHADAAGIPALALVTGLEVYRLDKGPGGRGSILAGPGATEADNRAKLLQLLKAAPTGERIALFQGTVAIALPDSDTLRYTTSTLECQVTTVERGEGGFDYDAVTQIVDRRTLAELDDEERSRLGHRGMALRAARKQLVALAAQLRQA